jgi:hypothetical protein
MDTIKITNDHFTSFDKANKYIIELYNKLPLLSFSIKEESFVSTKLDEAISAIVSNLESKNLSSDVPSVDKVKNAMLLFDANTKKKNELILKRIEHETLRAANNKIMWEKEIIPSLPILENIINEIKYCETILNDVEGLILLKEHGISESESKSESEIYNKLQEKKHNWNKYLNTYRQTSNFFLIKEDYINTISSDINRVEELLIKRKASFEKAKTSDALRDKQISEVNNKLADSTQNESEKNLLSVKKATLIECAESRKSTTYHSELLLKELEITLESLKSKKTHLSGYQECVHKLIDCINTLEQGIAMRQ